jgi:hypothetical protein
MRGCSQRSFEKMRFVLLFWTSQSRLGRFPKRLTEISLLVRPVILGCFDLHMGSLDILEQTPLAALSRTIACGLENNCGWRVMSRVLSGVREKGAQCPPSADSQICLAVVDDLRHRKQCRRFAVREGYLARSAQRVKGCQLVILGLGRDVADFRSRAQTDTFAIVSVHLVQDQAHQRTAVVLSGILRFSLP